MRHVFMKPYFTALLLILLVAKSGAQEDKYANSYVCQKGKTHFFASTPLQDIEATSDKTLCVINTDTKKVYAKVAMTSFEFKNKLMQEHFNENYAESDKYPNAILEAEIVENIDFKKDGTYDITLKGTFDVHGVKQNVELKGTLLVQKGQVQNAMATFNIKLEDYQVKIPTALLAKIAEAVKVDVDFNFEKFEKK
jgi:polyisoprenoid-binding protein YceI